MKKNILFIMTDQQRFDSLSCYGCESIRTPNLDRLAKEGIRFSQCYTNNPICTPSRASIFTGKPLPGHGVYRLHDDLPKTEKPFPWHLKQKGYKTALFGKLHLSSRVFEQSERHPYDGFDMYEESKSPFLPPSSLNAYLPWLEKNHASTYRDLQQKKRNFGNFPEEAHLTKRVSTRTIDFLKQQKPNQPFFCYTSFFDPHDPYNDYPKRFEHMVDKQKVAHVVQGPEDWNTMPEEIQREHFHGYLGNRESYSEEQIIKMKTGYYASIAFIDQEVGRILDTLDEMGLSDNTTVIFSSDHGDMVGDHGLLGKGAFFYDPCVKVPLIVRDPSMRDTGGISPASPSPTATSLTDGTSYSPEYPVAEHHVCDTIVQSNDIAATVLTRAGFSPSEIHNLMPDSYDLLATAARTTPSDRGAVCLYRGSSICDTKLYFDPPLNGGMYRWRDYKLTMYFRPAQPADTRAFSDRDHSPRDSAHVAGPDKNGTKQSPTAQLFNITEDPEELRDLWYDPEYATIKETMIMRFMNEINMMDYQYNHSRGGEHFPPKTHWSQNNPI